VLTHNITDFKIPVLISGNFPLKMDLNFPEKRIYLVRYTESFENFLSRISVSCDLAPGISGIFG